MWPSIKGQFQNKGTPVYKSDRQASPVFFHNTEDVTPGYAVFIGYLFRRKPGLFVAQNVEMLQLFVLHYTCGDALHYHFPA
jgi:hypothetical protein